MALQSATGNLSAKRNAFPKGRCGDWLDLKRFQRARRGSGARLGIVWVLESSTQGMIGSF